MVLGVRTGIADKRKPNVAEATSDDFGAAIKRTTSDNSGHIRTIPYQKATNEGLKKIIFEEYLYLRIEKKSELFIHLSLLYSYRSTFAGSPELEALLRISIF